MKLLLNIGFQRISVHFYKINVFICGLDLTSFNNLIQYGTR
jgi:hypothetical protein